MKRNSFLTRLARPAVLAVTLGVGAVALTLGALTPAAAQVAIDRPLELEAIDLEGNTRTGLETVLLYLPLRAGDQVTPYDLVDAVDELRASEIFSEVDFRTERGSRRGTLRLVLTVQENGLDFRLGTGFRDLDGWYLIPAQLRWDNLLGRGDRTRLQLGLGYRVTEVLLRFEEPRVGPDGRWFWGVQANAGVVGRRYFVDGVAYQHPVTFGGGEIGFGRRFGDRWTFSLAAGRQVVDPDSTAESVEDSEIRDIDYGDVLPFDQLPPSVAEHVDETRSTLTRADLVFDSRSPQTKNFTPVAGVWARVRTEAIWRENANASRAEIDLRGYRGLPAGATAVRVRAGLVEETAAFYDRYYLGGLYTVRGFLDQSLSPPGGHTRFWTASAEYRAHLAGDPRRPRLMGFVFVDAGQGWTEDQALRGEDIAVAAGYGFRVRIPWIDSFGVDFGVPLTDTPTETSWAANAALGWNF